LVSEIKTRGLWWFRTTPQQKDQERNENPRARTLKAKSNNCFWFLSQAKHGESWFFEETFSYQEKCLIYLEYPVSPSSCIDKKINEWCSCQKGYNLSL